MTYTAWDLQPFVQDCGYDGPPFRWDKAAHGEYRTKRVILEIYDAMQHTIETGQPYQTLVDPPPADPRVAHPPRKLGT